MIVNRTQLKEFIISEVKKSFLSSEEFNIGINDIFTEKSISEPETPIKLEEVVESVKEVKQLSEEFKRMNELMDFRSFIIGEK